MPVFLSTHTFIFTVGDSKRKREAMTWLKGIGDQYVKYLRKIVVAACQKGLKGMDPIVIEYHEKRAWRAQLRLPPSFSNDESFPSVVDILMLVPSSAREPHEPSFAGPTRRRQAKRRLKSITKAAVEQALDQGNSSLALAVQRLYEESHAKARLQYLLGCDHSSECYAERSGRVSARGQSCEDLGQEEPGSIQGS